MSPLPVICKTDHRCNRKTLHMLNVTDFGYIPSTHDDPMLGLRLSHAIIDLVEYAARHPSASDLDQYHRYVVVNDDELSHLLYDQGAFLNMDFLLEQCLMDWCIPFKNNVCAFYQKMAKDTDRYWGCCKLVKFSDRLTREVAFVY